MAANAQALLKRLDPRADEELIQITHARKDDLNEYTILGHIPVAEKQEMVARAITDEKLNRCLGSMCGMAVGDALGHPFEFMPAQDIPGNARFDLETMRFFDESNAFRLQRGQWTDDAAMGLCMADSLIMRRGFAGPDMRKRFWCWWNRGYNNAFRKDSSRCSSVGLGGNIAKSLMALTYAKGEPPEAYEATTEDAGNGSLMRFTPVSIYLHASPMQDVYDISRKCSYTTHPGIIAAEACSLLGHLVVAALNRPPGPVNPKEFLEVETVAYMEKSGLSTRPDSCGYNEMKWLVKGKPERPTEKCWAWRNENLDIAGTLRARGSSYNGHPVSAGYFGSYSMDGLAMAMWSVYHTTSFDEAVTRSVNLLGDADSHGSITGQLAGALYGYTAINKQFIDWLNQWDDSEFAVKAILLHHLGLNRSSEPSAAGLAPPKLGRTTTTAPQAAPPVLGRVQLPRRQLKRKSDRQGQQMRKPTKAIRAAELQSGNK